VLLTVISTLLLKVTFSPEVKVIVSEPGGSSAADGNISQKLNVKRIISINAKRYLESKIFLFKIFFSPI
jgi:hypothetical protein